MKQKTDWQKVKRDYIAGKKPAAICEKYNINYNTFTKQRVSGNWLEIKKKNNKKITIKQAEIIVKNTAESDSNRIGRIKEQANKEWLDAKEKAVASYEKSQKSVYDTYIYSKTLNIIHNGLWKANDIPDSREINIHIGQSIQDQIDEQKEKLVN
jgi:hypothetical protein